MNIREQELFWGFINKGKEDECWLWTGYTNERNYPIYIVRGSKHVAYVIAYEIVNETEVKPEHIIRHLCTSRTCCNPAHLVEGLTLDTTPEPATKPPKSKLLTRQDIRDILMLRGTFKQVEIARKYGVTQATISKVMNGKLY